MSKAFRKDGSKLQQPDWLARSRSNRTIFDPPNDPGAYINAYQITANNTEWFRVHLNHPTT